MNEKQVRLPCCSDSGKIALILCAFVLTSCAGDAARFRFDDYRTRLARALKLDAVQSVQLVDPARRPRKRDMWLEPEQSTISMIDFLRLYDCRLGEVIGERNSVLGKVAPASQRLFNDLAFLHHAPECISQLRTRQSDALADRLVEAVSGKLDGLTVSIANATLASDEFSGLWRVPVDLDDFPVNAGSATITELHYVTSQVESWLSGDFRFDSARFEQALGRLRHGQAGSLIAAATLTYSQLQSANRMIEQRLASRPLCFKGKPGRQGHILRRVVDRFFVGEVQVWLSRVSAQRHDLLAPYRLLEKHLEDAQTPAYRQWRDRRDSQLAWLSSAPREHVQSILPLLESCGLAPGSRQPEP
ncbi:DUF3080 family protein [Granulosicoccus sp. 3-233]|uniref:DUF3080 family protein n=1 Tax=Granulosicoccus sp. 3-233 TaxID=3417969 RepID=UPI003D3404B7